MRVGLAEIHLFVCVYSSLSFVRSFVRSLVRSFVVADMISSLVDVYVCASFTNVCCLIMSIDNCLLRFNFNRSFVCVCVCMSILSSLLHNTV